MTKTQLLRRIFFPTALLFIPSLGVSQGPSLDDLPPELVTKHILKSMTHKEIVSTVGHVSKKFHALSLSDSTWTRTLITSQKELNLFLEASKTRPQLPVEEFQLTNLTLSSAQTLSLMDVLCSEKTPHLKRFSVLNCKLNFEEIDKGKFSSFQQWLGAHSQLNELHFVKTSLPFPFVSSVCRGLKDNESLRELTFDEVFKLGTLPPHFSESVENNTTLKTFNFRDNIVTSSYDDNPIGQMEAINKRDRLKCFFEGTETRLVL